VTAYDQGWFVGGRKGRNKSTHIAWVEVAAETLSLLGHDVSVWVILAISVIRVVEIIKIHGDTFVSGDIRRRKTEMREGLASQVPGLR